MGYKLAGFNVLGNCEIDSTIAEVYKANLRPKYSFIEDLREFNQRQDLPDDLYNLDVLDGSPPCSTFSMLGGREKTWGVEKRFAEGQALQTLDDLLFVYLDAVEKLKPKAFLLENVKGLILGNARGYCNEIVKRCQAMGYDVQVFLLNAAFAGVPQRRERVFFIGNRMGYPKLKLDFNEDPILFGEVRTVQAGERPGPMARKWLNLYQKGDKSLEAVAKRNGGSGWFNHVVADDDRVCPTLRATLGTYREAGRTYLSKADMRSVSTFPQDYRIDNDTSARWHFICGMSVPPVLIANIATEIKEQWLCLKK